MQKKKSEEEEESDIQSIWKSRAMASIPNGKDFCLLIRSGHQRFGFYFTRFATRWVADPSLLQAKPILKKKKRQITLEIEERCKF